MKTIKWFEEGQEIPDNAKFIKSELRFIGNPIPFETYGALYEIPLDDKTIKTKINVSHDWKTAFRS